MISGPSSLTAPRVHAISGPYGDERGTRGKMRLEPKGMRLLRGAHALFAALLLAVPIALNLDTGIIVNSEIDNTTQNPASVAVPVTFPQNVLVTVNVWTR